MASQRIFLSDKPRFSDKVEELLEFIEDSPLVAHNAGFDFGFLNFELERCGRSSVCMSRMIDTLQLARTRHPGAKHSLDALCMRFGIDRSHRVKHGALLDAQLLAQVYVELTGGRQIGLGLVADTGQCRGAGRVAARHDSRAAARSAALRGGRGTCASPRVYRSIGQPAVGAFRHRQLTAPCGRS